jgi:putative addiction module killer protein
MNALIQTDTFKSWIKSLKDKTAVARINARLLRVKEGNFGDFKSVGDGVRELRFVFGPGYRVYYAQVEDQIILLLAGGDKSSQSNDIVDAKQILREWKEDQNA